MFIETMLMMLVLLGGLVIVDYWPEIKSYYRAVFGLKGRRYRGHLSIKWGEGWASDPMKPVYRDTISEIVEYAGVLAKAHPRPHSVVLVVFEADSGAMRSTQAWHKGRLCTRV